MAPDLEAAHQYLDRFNLKGLFIESLGWEPPGAPQTLTIRALDSPIGPMGLLAEVRPAFGK